MLKLNLSREPYWLDLPKGVRLRVRPIGTSLMLDVYQEPEVAALSEDTDDGTAGAILGRAIMQHAIEEWEGVADERGRPLKITREAIEALLEDFTLWTALQERYIGPALEFQDEGNGSAPSPNGSSEGAPDTAKPARSSAKNARGGSTSRARQKGARSGRSSGA